MKVSIPLRLDLFLTTTAGFLIAAVCANASPPQYTITDLGSLGGSPTVAEAINNAGQIVGYSTFSDGTTHAVVWNGTSTPTDLGVVPGGTQSEAYSINSLGQIAGMSYISGSIQRAVRWDGLSITQFDVPSGYFHSFSTAINSSGQSAGGLLTSTGAQQAAMWTGTTATILDSIGQGNGSIAQGINDSGVVVGVSGSRAIMWNGTTPIDLGTLGGQKSQAMEINNANYIVGSADIASGAAHAVIWIGLTPTDLGTLGGTNSYATEINSNGVVVGMSEITGSSTQHPFLFKDGTMYDLDQLIVNGAGITNLKVDGGGNAINDSEQIVAYGTKGGTTHAFLLSPVPEPAAASFFVIGASLLALQRRRS